MYEYIDKFYIQSINDHILPIGKYAVIKLGHVLSRDPVTCKFRELKLFPDGRRGYLKVKLYSNEHKGITVPVHRLVYTTIKGIKYGSQGTVNHINGDKLDNHYDNLELISNIDNIRHAIANKLSPTRAHMLTVESATELYLKALEDHHNGYSMGHTARNAGYDCKVISQLIRKVHTLSNEIDQYLESNPR